MSIEEVSKQIEELIQLNKEQAKITEEIKEEYEAQKELGEKILEEIDYLNRNTVGYGIDNRIEYR